MKALKNGKYQGGELVSGYLVNIKIFKDEKKYFMYFPAQYVQIYFNQETQH